MKIERVPVQIARSGSGRFWCRYPGQVPESSCTGHSGGFRCTYPGQVPEVRFRKIPVQRLGQVLEGSGADYQVRIRKVPEDPEGSGTEVR